MSEEFRVVARLADLGDPGAREFFAGDGDWPFRGFLVQVDGVSGDAREHEAFTAFVNELAMHVAAASPQYTNRDDVPADAVEKEKDIYRAQIAESGKPPSVIEKIIEGKLGAFFEQIVLVDQPTIRDPKVKVSQALEAVSKTIGQPLTIRTFARFKVGEAGA